MIIHDYDNDKCDYDDLIHQYLENDYDNCGHGFMMHYDNEKCDYDDLTHDDDDDDNDNVIMVI